MGDRATGLCGWISLQYGDLVLDGIALRETLEGRLRLAFPAKTDACGRKYPYIRPVDARARAAIEDAVLQALSLPTGNSR